MVQFDNKRGTLPGLDMLEVFTRKREMTVKSDSSTGAAWLSSARVVRCSVKSGNERNPHGQLLYLAELPRTQYICENKCVECGEEGEDDVKSAWLLRPGRHTCYNGRLQWVAKP